MFFITFHATVEICQRTFYNVRKYLRDSAQAAQAHDVRSSNNTLLKYAKRDSHLVTYGGVVLQRFVFIKVCMGVNPFEFIAKYNDILTMKSTSVDVLVYVCCYLGSQADTRRFKRVMPFWVSTAKKK